MWILLIVFLAGDGIATEQHPFESEQGCMEVLKMFNERKSDLLQERHKNGLDKRFNDLEAVCVLE